VPSVRDGLPSARRSQPNQVINGVMSGLDWFPTFMAAAGYEGDIAADLRKGKTLNGKEYKVHLDGYNQMESRKAIRPSPRC